MISAYQKESMFKTSHPYSALLVGSKSSYMGSDTKFSRKVYFGKLTSMAIEAGKA